MEFQFAFMLNGKEVLRDQIGTSVLHKATMHKLNRPTDVVSVQVLTQCPVCEAFNDYGNCPSHCNYSQL